MMEIPVLTDEGTSLPEYGSEKAAGADVRAKCTAPIEIAPGDSALISTGLYFEIPSGFEIQIRPRSGLALKKQLTVLNSPGTIDADYRGELKVILINHGKQAFIVQPGMRIAQLVVAPVVKAHFVNANVLVESGRGSRGFGHTGVD